MRKKLVSLVLKLSKPTWRGRVWVFLWLKWCRRCRECFVKETDGAVRPMIVSLDGWAGTQRHAGIWTGDQTVVNGNIFASISQHISGLRCLTTKCRFRYGWNFGGKIKRSTYVISNGKLLHQCANMDGWGSNPKRHLLLIKKPQI